MNYREWEKEVPEEIRADRVWRVEAYRLALFAADVGRRDVTKLMGDRRARGVADQWYRALGSISLAMVPEQRQDGQALREPSAPYAPSPEPLTAVPF